jgi:2-hydroxy-3-keto-5-methylthiopentenyl-1-phosphate phosphatase
MEELGIPVVVISGGLKPYVMEKLGPFQDRLLGIHSVDLDYSGDFMRLLPEYEEDGELMQKTLVMDQYDYKRAICVGDSMTDVGMAKVCQLVFARDLLAKLLDKDGVAYVPWNNFHDIKDYILKWAQS